MILAMMVGLPAATMAQQEQTGLRRVHLMTGAGTIPRNPAYRLEYLRYATTGEPRLTGTQMIERIPEVQKFARVTVESDEFIPYDQPKELPASAEGQERRLRAEMHRRMLGNGYCARPVGLDCHFESICESCTFFQTTLEFRPTLERQRDDARAKGQVGRQRVFDGLLQRLEEKAS